MTAPPGWHPQPDGRDRYWDGVQWTDHFRWPQPPAPPHSPYAATPPQGTGGMAQGCLRAAGITVLLLFGMGACLAMVSDGEDGSPSTASSSTATPGSTTSSDDTSAEVNPSPTPTAPKTPTVDPDDVGDEEHPVTITEGKAFDIRKFSYAAGWSIEDDSFGMSIENLKVTNNRGERDGAFVQIKFMRGSEVMAVIDCSSDQILPGQTVTLNCGGFGDDRPEKYDRITINDTF